jgi:hypothetical protein
MITRYLYTKGNIVFVAKGLHVFILFLTLIIFSLFFYSCSKEKIEAQKPIKELIVDLKSKNPNCTCEPYINQYVWRNENVFVLGYKGPTCDWFPTFYDTNGQKFTLDSGYSYDAFLQESTFIKNVWTCE